MLLRPVESHWVNEVGGDPTIRPDWTIRIVRRWSDSGDAQVLQVSGNEFWQAYRTNG
jgi:hypothetical protein